MRLKSKKSDPDRMRLDPDNYKWGIFYFNPDDPRIFLPKRIPLMGFTLNFANPYSYLILILLLAIILFMTQIGVPHSHFPKISQIPGN